MLRPDLAKLLAARAAPSTAGAAGAAGGGRGSVHTLKALISVPRLNGGKMGVLATRSPHRPVPIGLSTAQVGWGWSLLCVVLGGGRGGALLSPSVNLPVGALAAKRVGMRKAGLIQVELTQ